MAPRDFEWIRRRLISRGFTQSQLAKVWETDSGFVSRFFSEARADLITLNRSAILSRMLGMSLDEFTAQLGLAGSGSLIPAMTPTELPPLNTFSVIPADGSLQIVANLVVNPAKAGDLLAVLANLTKK